MFEIEWLPAKIVSQIGKAVESLKADLGSHLVAVALVGAAAHPERHDRAQQPELLAVVGELSTKDLRKLASAMRTQLSRRVRLRVITSEELRSSADVFSVEVADYQHHHVTLYGDDPFDDLSIAPTDLRRGVEQALRGLGRRARNRVLSGMNPARGIDEPQRVAAQSIERLVLLLRLTLEVLGHEAPAEEDALLARTAEVIGCDVDWLLQALHSIRAGKKIDDPIDFSCRLLALLKPVISAVDAAQPEAA